MTEYSYILTQRTFITDSKKGTAKDRVITIYFLYSDQVLSVTDKKQCARVTDEYLKKRVCERYKTTSISGLMHSLNKLLNKYN